MNSYNQLIKKNMYWQKIQHQQQSKQLVHWQFFTVYFNSINVLVYNYTLLKYRLIFGPGIGTTINHPLRRTLVRLAQYAAPKKLQ